MIKLAGGGVVNARTLLRSVGFRFSNSAMTSLFREFRAIELRAPGLSRIPLAFRPGIATISRINLSMRTRYQYTGIAKLVDIELGIEQEISVSFGDDRLLTRREILERMEAIAEQVANLGGQNYDMDDAKVDSIDLTAVLEGSR